jgi:hypothetical protein
VAVRGLAFRALPLGLPRTTPWSLPLPAVIALVFDTKTGLALAVGILWSPYPLHPSAANES